MRRHSAGFTAIEMVIVMVVAGIMMAIAIPFLRNTSQKTSVSGAADEISRLYATARAASMTRSTSAPVTSLSRMATMPCELRLRIWLPAMPA